MGFMYLPCKELYFGKESKVKKLFFGLLKPMI